MKFVLSVQVYSDATSANSVFVSDKIINNSDNFRIKYLSYNKKVHFYVFFSFCPSTFLFKLNWKTFQLISEHFVSLDIFDTCDVVYNSPISLLPPIVLDDLFQ